MEEWYRDYYRAIRTSRANALFCERAYGRDLGQHGFMDEAQLDALLDALALRTGELALDLGCGDGRIAELLAARAGARFVGIDNVRPAIESAALRRVGGGLDRAGDLDLALMSMGALGFLPETFDAVIAVDTLYFTPLDETVEGIRRVLRPMGRLAAYYSYDLPAGGDASSLEPDRTPLAEALRRAGLDFEARDFTSADYEHARRRMAVLADLADLFLSEGLGFLLENRLGEATGVSRAVESGIHRRYLYLARRPERAPAARGPMSAIPMTAIVRSGIASGNPPRETTGGAGS